MEKVGKVLANLKTDTTIPHPITKVSEEATAEEQREELRKSLGVSTLTNTFDNFKPEKGAENALKACQALASGETKWQMLLLYGGVGNGKTHLLEALVIELYKQGRFCRVAVFSRMMSFLKSTMDKGSELSLEGIKDNWCRAERLVIDDVGMGGSDTGWSMKMLEEIIVPRYKDNLLTVLSTNADISELPERIVSRFRDKEKARLVLNAAPDYRPKKLPS